MSIDLTVGDIDEIGSELAPRSYIREWSVQWCHDMGAMGVHVARFVVRDAQGKETPHEVRVDHLTLRRGGYADTREYEIAARRALVAEAKLHLVRARGPALPAKPAASYSAGSATIEIDGQSIRCLSFTADDSARPAPETQYAREDHAHPTPGEQALRALFETRIGEHVEGATRIGSPVPEVKIDYPYPDDSRARIRLFLGTSESGLTLPRDTPPKLLAAEMSRLVDSVAEQERSKKIAAYDEERARKNAPYRVLYATPGSAPGCEPTPSAAEVASKVADEVAHGKHRVALQKIVSDALFRGTDVTVYSARNAFAGEVFFGTLPKGETWSPEVLSNRLPHLSPSFVGGGGQPYEHDDDDDVPPLSLAEIEQHVREGTRGINPAIKVLVDALRADYEDGDYREVRVWLTLAGKEHSYVAQNDDDADAVVDEAKEEAIDLCCQVGQAWRPAGWKDEP